MKENSHSNADFVFQKVASAIHSQCLYHSGASTRKHLNEEKVHYIIYFHQSCQICLNTVLREMERGKSLDLFCEIYIKKT